jgi:hypothetical protein
MAESSWCLGVYFWSSCYVRWWWNGFRTQVHTVICAWVPTATSLRARCLRSLLPETPGLALLIRCRKPPVTFDQGIGSLPRVNKRGGRGRQVMKFHLPILIVGWRSDGVDCSRGLVLFRLVAPPLQPGLVEPIRYRVYGSPAICRLRKPVVSRILGCNGWPAVPGVHYRNSSPLSPPFSGWSKPVTQ